MSFIVEPYSSPVIDSMTDYNDNENGFLEGGNDKRKQLQQDNCEAISVAKHTTSFLEGGNDDKRSKREVGQGETSPLQKQEVNKCKQLQQDNCETISVAKQEVYEKILFDHDDQREIITKALDLVEKFIKDNKRLLTGGMAIDFGLKLKGKSLYGPNKIRDLDFYSPDFHADAYNIGKILVKKGLPNISIINAKHTSTMRVRTNFEVVADITYMPEKIFKRLPTIKYKGFLCVHPQYQICHQHIALSYPYTDPPLEPINNRWKKVIKRHDMIYPYYPVSTNFNSGLFSRYTFPKNKLKKNCLMGFPALAYWYTKALKLGFKPKEPRKHNLKIESKENDLYIYLPKSKGIRFSVYSDDFLETISNFHFKNAKMELYNKFMDLLKRYVLIKKDDCPEDIPVEIFDNYGMFLSASKSDFDDAIYVANLQPVMCYMLSKYLLASMNFEIDKDIYSYGYLLSREIVGWFSREYINSKQDKYTQFLPTEEYYGSINIGESYKHQRKQFDIKLGDARKPYNPEMPNVAFPSKESLKIPIEYYQFDPKESPLYQINGLKKKDLKIEDLSSL